ncbi:MAG: ABC transporter ATP-binding protein [Chitinophagaceae bacterium]
MNPLIEVSHLKKYFSTQKAVDDISFSIEKGSIFGMLGPNGAGKTTLLRMITGIFYPDAGQITFQGKPFDPLQDVRHIGYMPEERGLYKKMKIGEHALYLAQLKGLSRAEAMKQVKQWFERLEMQSWWNKKVEDLSKGMSQKLQFVITVMHEPDLIILDEPFSGLDPVNTNLIKAEIQRLARQGASILFSTHRMEQVEEICDQIILVNKGHKILDGTVPDIKKQYKEHLYVLEFETEVNPLPSSPLFECVHQEARQVILRIPPNTTTNAVLQHFIEARIPVTGFRELLPSLNDIFIKLVEGTPFSRQFETKANAQP